MKTQTEKALCICPCCSVETFRLFFGRNPGSNPKKRRTHAEVVLQKREKALLLQKKREARARFLAQVKHRTSKKGLATTL